ncbi:MAG: PorV/PorQ family protein [Bacteroidetes bacterium]|nr:PorV/PorQ family protein [Bacteroidota bacterium]
MKHTTKLLTAIFAGVFFSGYSFAGNPDRAGQAGASELLINPWARNSGWADANMAGAHGLEAQFLNVAGTAFTKKTELLFAHTNYLSGSGIGLNAFGFSQHVGTSGVLGVGIMSMNFGDIPVTTYDLPEGGLGNFKISIININTSYARAFTDHIFGGMNLKVLQEAIPNAKAAGAALDAGIQYVTGKMNSTKFGISLKNVGSKMRFSGDGLSFRETSVNGTVSGLDHVVSSRSDAYEMPSQLNMGGAHDFYLGGDSASKMHRITLAATFTSNSFGKDQEKVGVEYGFKSFLMLRAGYLIEKGIRNKDNTADPPIRTTAFTGFSAGFTVELPINKEKGSTFGLDYGYRATNPFNGTHTIGLRMSL